MGGCCAQPLREGEHSEDGDSLLEARPPSDAPAAAVFPRPVRIAQRPLWSAFDGAVPKVALGVVVLANVVGLWHVLVSGRHAEKGCVDARVVFTHEEKCDVEAHLLAAAFFDVECVRALNLPCALGEVNSFMSVFADEARPIAQLTVAPTLVILIAVAQFGKVPSPVGTVGAFGFGLWLVFTVLQWAAGVHTLVSSVGTFLAAHHRFLCCERPWAPEWWPRGPRLLDVVALTTAGLQPSVLAALALALMHPLALMAAAQAARHARAEGEEVSPLMMRVCALLESALVQGVARAQAWLTIGAVGCSLAWTLPTLGALAALALAPLMALAFFAAFGVVLPLAQRLHQALARAAGDDFVDFDLGGFKERQRVVRRLRDGTLVAAAARDALHWLDPAKTRADVLRVRTMVQLPRSPVSLFFAVVIVAQVLSSPAVFGVWSAMSALGAEDPALAVFDALSTQYRFVVSELRNFRLTLSWQLLSWAELEQCLAQPWRLFPRLAVANVHELILAGRALLTLGLVLAVAKFASVGALKVGMLIAHCLCRAPASEQVSVSELMWVAEGSAHVQPRRVLGQSEVAFRAEKGFGEGDALVLAELLQLERSPLQLLAVTDCGLSDESVRAVLAALHARDVHVLELYGNGLSARGAFAIAAALRHLPSLTELDLNINSIGAEGASAIAAELHHLTLLTSLTLYNNGIGAEGAAALASALRKLRSMKTLTLSRNGIGAQGATALAGALQHLPSLTSLTLSRNGVGAQGAAALAGELHHLALLTNFTLYSNAIGAQGAAALARALPHLTSLITLNLSDNAVGAQGVSAIAATLHHLVMLSTLSLYDNKLGAQGASALAKALRHVPSLTKLELHGNGIGDQGAAAIAAVLHHLVLLKTLTLNNNGIGDHGASALTVALSHLTSLTELDLRDNTGISEYATAALRAAWLHDPSDLALNEELSLL